MEKERNRPKTYKTIARRIIALTLSIWLVFMLCLTWAVAKDFQRQIEKLTKEMIAGDIPVHYGGHDQVVSQGSRNVQRIMQLGSPYAWLHTEKLFPFVMDQTPDSMGDDDWYWGRWELLYGFQPALIFYDENRKPQIKSGNLLTFSYCMEESWKGQTPEICDYGYIDLDAMSYGQEKISSGLWGSATATFVSSFSSPLLRMTGWFEEGQFHPVSIDRYFESFYPEYTPETLAKRDGRGAVEWERVYDADTPDGVEPITIYSWETGGYQYTHQPMTVRGVHYNSLVDYLDAGIQDESWWNQYRSDNLFDSIIIFTGELEDDTEMDLCAIAVRCWPMQYAALRLIPTYLVSLALVAVALWLILRSIRRNVTDTLKMLIHRIEQDAPIEHLSNWQEPHTLETILKGEQENRRQLVNDNQQLQKSLEFAKNAEENRRQLVSNITHELKTPLAIIHSYAEGLQSGIAEEKREKYLSTILEEAERMDAMVLEMLDHSRLESGKVKLSADHFSLWKLTESVAEKLTPAMEEKQLILSWGFCNDCMLTADESRLAQVVTNLFTNAIRYTPEGGVIHLRVFSDAKDATFQIENEAEHLPAEVLEKIFDSFYRVDDSRTAKGTGLGLPIARSILQLHRGSIQAMNTYVNRKSCIQFSFTIPLK